MRWLLTSPGDQHKLYWWSWVNGSLSAIISAGQWMKCRTMLRMMISTKPKLHTDISLNQIRWSINHPKETTSDGRQNCLACGVCDVSLSNVFVTKTYVNYSFPRTYHHILYLNCFYVIWNDTAKEFCLVGVRVYALISYWNRVTDLWSS